MRRPLGLLLLASATSLHAADDAAAPVRQFIDGFNGGDTKSAFAAYAPGDIVIIDEFAPFRWTGPRAAQQWAADYGKHAKATGVTGGKVSYGKPTRQEVAGDTGYVIVPTVYSYKEKGRAMAEEGSITASVRRAPDGWKLTGWTWSGVAPHAAK